MRFALGVVLSILMARTASFAREPEPGFEVFNQTAADATFFLDGKKVATVAPGSFAAVKVRKGRHKVRVESSGSRLDAMACVIQIPDVGVVGTCRLEADGLKCDDDPNCGK